MANINVEVEIEGKKKMIEIKRVSFRKYLEILKKCTKTELIGDKIKTNLESSDYRWEMVKESVVGLTLMELDKIDMIEGMKLEKVVSEVNNFEDTASFPEK